MMDVRSEPLLIWATKILAIQMDTTFFDVCTFKRDFSSAQNRHPPISAWHILTDAFRPRSKVPFCEDSWRPQEGGSSLFCASPPVSVQTSMMSWITFYACYLCTYLSLSLRYWTSWGQELCLVYFCIQVVCFKVQAQQVSHREVKAL